MRIPTLTSCCLLLLVVACDGAPSREQMSEDGRAVLASLGELVDTLGNTHTAAAVRNGVDELVLKLGELKDRAAASSRAVAEDPDVQAALTRTRQALADIERRLQDVIEDQELRDALQTAADRLRAQLQG